MTLVKETSTVVQEPLRKQSYGAVRSPDRLSLGRPPSGVLKTTEAIGLLPPLVWALTGWVRWGTEEMTELKLREAGAARLGADVWCGSGGLRRVIK